jgi:hypothetical protein
MLLDKVDQSSNVAFKEAHQAHRCPQQSLVPMSPPHMVLTAHGALPTRGTPVAGGTRVGRGSTSNLVGLYRNNHAYCKHTAGTGSLPDSLRLRPATASPHCAGGATLDSTFS